ncbi:sal-like protein 3b [Osmerus mordax]|uniref:sal-like protein 3b n=1 Tax=Osmerus mordax TaxID=8014 RepID=UPI00350FDDE8
MSRRKQPKPQHLSSDEDPFQTGVSENALLLDPLVEEEEGGGRPAGHRGGDTHICEKCCAEFFTWTELWAHQSGCEEPLVLIMKEHQGTLGPEDLHAGASPDPSSTPSDPADLASADEGFQGVENSYDSLDTLEEREEEENMEQDLQHQEGDKQQASSPQSPRSIQSASPGVSAAGSCGVPTTNVTLEILQSTRVAVAQFSQGIHTGRGGGKATTAAISAILEHLQALQQQQVLQLQLIEQVRSQVSDMNRQPTQTALDPVTRALPLTPNSFPSRHPSILAPSVIPSSGMMPSAINGQASVSLASVLERSHALSSHTAYGQSIFRDGARTSTSSETPVAPSSSCSDVSIILPPYTGAYSGVKCGQTLISSSPPSQGDALQGSLSSSLPLLPQSPPSTVIFPNPLARIAATANAFEPLAILMKQGRAKLPSVSLFDTKPCREEQFFKHKCRFCSKVFGSDSALQIHLRSHTGERPFKCNICGNRFSTKGNLKVHFQRHKDKYPHVQMNPYPVPEYLDSVPTSQGVPYGMSFPQEKNGSLWLDSKPVVATVTTSMGLQLPSSLSAGGNWTDSVSVTPSIKSPHASASCEHASLSPAASHEVPIPPPSESPRSKDEGESHDATKAEEVHLPQNCSARHAGNSVSMATSTAPSKTTPTPEPSAPASPYTYDPSPLSLPTDHFKVGFPFGGHLVSMETSETSKLQKLVENIDKTDANQCVLCHRILSCQSALKMHYRVHTGERPFRCKVCGRTFTTKGNLKTHIGVHRASPPLRMQHSCPICQKKFTNAVVLQQHIRMHMAGQIPDSSHADGLQGTGPAELSVNEINTDGFSSQETDFTDGNSMEDDEEEEDEMEENTEEGVDPFKALTSLASSPPKSSAVVSNIAALENQMKIIDSTSGLNHTFGMKGFLDSDCFTTNSSYTPIPFIMREAENLSKTVSKCSRSVAASAAPGQSISEGNLSSSSEDTLTESRDVAVSVKNENSGSSSQDQTGTQPNQPSINEDSPYSMMFQSRERAPHQNIPSLVSSTAPNPAGTELNGHGRPAVLSERRQHSFGLPVLAAKSCVGPSGMMALLTPAPAQPRRTPKQHNCNICGKNFSSASALQIHERTHTGEKPFGCSVCGRAFTTKGNLKVHMGTHMWNNSPVRRGRRLSVENPMALLGGDAVKFGEMFQKDLAARAMNADAGFWNRYAAAITNSLTLKNNGMSVVQNEGITQLHAMTAGMESLKAGGSPPLSSLGNTGRNMGVHTHFSMLVDDSKNIGIN